MSQVFAVMDVNPNEGGGCLCSEIGTQDSQGPFVVFSATEMDTVHSPFPVLCAGCALKAGADIAASSLPPRTLRAEDVLGPLNESRTPRQPKRQTLKRSSEDGPTI